MTEIHSTMMTRLKDLLANVVPRRWRAGVAVVPIVRLSGIIGFSTPLRPGLTLAGTARVLDKAFGIRGAAAVALVINSPGGSAVQSHLIYARIRALAAEKKLPVLAFVEDVAASGGYMIACAADEIICDPSSIVGSIGVVGATFGFDEAIKKLGIERRIYTSGEHKVMLDPFKPEDPEDVARLKAIQQEIHRSFIDLVKSSRGDRLTGPEKTLFSGEYWTASTARSYGIVDSLGDTRSVLRERFGDKVLTPVVMGARGWLGRAVPGVVGSQLFERAGFADDFVSTLETRAMWARYGL
jgi:signal peptide peptidase SppA